MMDQEYINRYLDEVIKIAQQIDREQIAKIIDILSQAREQGGRVFFIGVGGSAANASHAAADFRMTCNIETYAPHDNIPQLTAVTNDYGFEHIFVRWLEGSKFNSNDVLFVLSVGGGSEHTSKNLVLAMKEAKNRGAKILGIVGRDGGATKKLADACVLVPSVTPDRITPHTEGWQSVLLHLMVDMLKQREYRWEGIDKIQN